MFPTGSQLIANKLVFSLYTDPTAQFNAYLHSVSKSRQTFLFENGYLKNNKYFWNLWSTAVKPRREQNSNELLSVSKADNI